MKRKIVQIAIAAGGIEMFDVLFALADDGTLWRKVIKESEKTKWTEIEPLPEQQSQFARRTS